MSFVACPVSSTPIRFTFFFHKMLSLVSLTFTLCLPESKTLEFSLSYNLSFAVSQEILFFPVPYFCNIFSKHLPSLVPQKLITIQPNP